jgi:hypothetical protein
MSFEGHLVEGVENRKPNCAYSNYDKRSLEPSCETILSLVLILYQVLFVLAGRVGSGLLRSKDYNTDTQSPNQDEQ